MRNHLMVAWLTAGITAAVLSAAETAPPTPPAAGAEAGKVADVEDAIPAPVKALAAPAMREFAGGIQMAVSAATAEAQAHVNQGLNHLHGGWEFEASRHFAAAMREDPDCLLAHWGMVMSLLNPSPETSAARDAATDRLYGLIEQGKGTELERGYAFGLIKYLENGPNGGAAAFRKVAGKFPNELQAGVFAALFSRGGFDAVGEPTLDQQTAEKSLRELIAKNPQSPVPLTALLIIRAEGPDLSDSLELARKLCQLAPDYAPNLHMLGHYEWRCGHHSAAIAAFAQAGGLYQRWMKDNKAGIADCPEWGRAESYRIVALRSKGEFEIAYAAARELAATPLPADRPASPGSRFLLWEGVTLPARVLMDRSLRGNAKEAAHSLPTPQAVTEFRKHSLAYWWIDGLRFALEAQRLTDAGELASARDVVALLSQHGENMATTQALAAASGERSAWTRAFHALEVLASDVRGRLVLAGPKEKQGTAYNWFSSAEDRQRPASMLFPPAILTPMAARLGDYFLANHKASEAIEAYQRALGAFPNDMNALVGLLHAYQAAENPAAAAAISEKIATLKAE